MAFALRFVSSAAPMLLPAARALVRVAMSRSARTVAGGKQTGCLSAETAARRRERCVSCCPSHRVRKLELLNDCQSFSKAIRLPAGGAGSSLAPSRVTILSHTAQKNASSASGSSPVRSPRFAHRGRSPATRRDKLHAPGPRTRPGAFVTRSKIALLSPARSLVVLVSAWLRCCQACNVTPPPPDFVS